MTLEEEVKKQAEATERIANYMKDVGQVIFYIIIGVFVTALIFLFFVIAPPVYQYINYDLLGNDRPDSYYYPTSLPPPDPIEDCSYSKDPQLCYQMKRIGDSLKLQDDSEFKPFEVKTQTIDSLNTTLTWTESLDMPYGDYGSFNKWCYGTGGWLQSGLCVKDCSGKTECGDWVK